MSKITRAFLVIGCIGYEMSAWGMDKGEEITNKYRPEIGRISQNACNPRNFNKEECARSLRLLVGRVESDYDANNKGAFREYLNNWVETTVKNMESRHDKLREKK